MNEAWGLEYWDDHRSWLWIAQEASKAGTCLRRKVGAVLTILDEDLGSVYAFTGWNTAPPGAVTCEEAGECYLVPSERGPSCVRTVHGETNAIASALRSGFSPRGGRMYLTGDPCINCAKMLAAFGIELVVHPGSLGYLPGHVKEVIVPELKILEVKL